MATYILLIIVVGVVILWFARIGKTRSMTLRTRRKGKNGLTPKIEADDDEGPGTYGGPYNRHPKYPPGRDK
jgi:uncharacterized membrane protein